MYVDKIFKLILFLILSALIRCIQAININLYKTETNNFDKKIKIIIIHIIPVYSTLIFYYILFLLSNILLFHQSKKEIKYFRINQDKE